MTVKLSCLEKQMQKLSCLERKKVMTKAKRLVQTAPGSGDASEASEIQENARLLVLSRLALVMFFPANKLGSFFLKGTQGLKPNKKE